MNLHLYFKPIKLLSKQFYPYYRFRRFNNAKILLLSAVNTRPPDSMCLMHGFRTKIAELAGFTCPHDN